MSHFYSRIKGMKGEATRCGSKSSGMYATAFGWDIGGSVRVVYDEKLDTDIVHFYLTRSNNRTSTPVASFAVIDGRQVCLQTSYPELLV